MILAPNVAFSIRRKAGLSEAGSAVLKLSLKCPESTCLPRRGRGVQTPHWILGVFGFCLYTNFLQENVKNLALISYFASASLPEP